MEIEEYLDTQSPATWTASRAEITLYQCRMIWQAAKRDAAIEAIEACNSTRDEPDSFGVLDQLSEYGNTSIKCCIDAIKEKFGLEI